jgi:glycosyltransferase involved in cell wall biosynthesis
MNGKRQLQPTLTIAIPTWNRAPYLRLNLEQLAAQFPAVARKVEILISDNCSTDETPEVVNGFVAHGLPIRYIRNPENIGSDCNIAQCFNEAAGRYVLILGDDDLLVDGALGILLALLENKRYGVLSMRPYGYDTDFRLEHPGGGSLVHEYTDVGKFVVAMGAFSTLISAIIISKELLSEVDAREFCGSNLVQTNLAYRAALAAEMNVCVDQYLVACKRNNTGGYAFSQVFVDYLGAILDECQVLGLPPEAVAKLEQRLLIGYYPYYIWRQRLGGGEDLQEAWGRFRTRYGGRWAFQLFVMPIFRLPRPLALILGGVAVAVGRVVNGDARRGLSFAWHRLTRNVG